MSAYIVPQFSDLELFKMFNIDVRSALLQQAKVARHTDRVKARSLCKAARKAGFGRNAWYMNKKQRGGAVNDFDTDEKQREAPEVKSARIEALRTFYSAMSPADMQVKLYTAVKDHDGEEIDLEPIPGAIMPPSPFDL